MKIIMSICFIALGYSCNLLNQRPPQTIVVEAPTSVANTIKSGEWLLLIRLTKADGLWYKYDTTASDISMKKIEPITTENIKAALSDIEKTYNLKLDTSKNILFKSDADLPNEDFNIIIVFMRRISQFEFEVNKNDSSGQPQ